VKAYHKNPRLINERQFSELRRWLAELGDLSGIVHDLNSDEIIAGNQRGLVFNIDNCDIYTPQETYNDPPDAQGTVNTGYIIWQGHRYNYRAVRWTPEQCEQANIIANRAGGDWDWDVLTSQFDMPDLLSWGFDKLEFGMLDSDFQVPPIEDTLDDSAEFTCRIVAPYDVSTQLIEYLDSLASKGVKWART
jgi:hypothetical protein